MTPYQVWMQEREDARELFGDAAHCVGQAHNMFLLGNMPTAWRWLEHAAYFYEHAKCAARRAADAARRDYHARHSRAA